MPASTEGFLNSAVLEAINPAEFQQRTPFPWVNPQQFIRADHSQELLDNLPALERFRGFFGKQRKHGQTSHDRYILDYEAGMALPTCWQTLVDELCSDQYRAFVCRLLDVSAVRFRFHWHFTPAGGEVSPHCDSRGKIGSQIFYLNTEQDWDRSWGGETVILDDGGLIGPDNAPAFDEFIAEYPAETSYNHSLLFGRRGNSWHGVRKINCPPDHYRKVFIVVFEEHRPMHMALKKLQRLLTGKTMVTQKEGLMY